MPTEHDCSIYWTAADDADALGSGELHTWLASPWDDGDTVGITAHPFASLNNGEDPLLAVEDVQLKTDGDEDHCALLFTVRNVGHHEINGYTLEFFRVESDAPQTQSRGAPSHASPATAPTSPPVFRICSN
jgi:hypothetical protein